MCVVPAMTVQEVYCCCCCCSIHLICLVSVALPVICLPPLHTRKQQSSHTHTYNPHVFLAGALAVSARSRTTRNWWERKFHELVSSLSPSLLSAAPSTTTTAAATQAAVTEAAAFAVSSSAAAVTFFFLFFFYFVFHDFFLAASAFAPHSSPCQCGCFSFSNYNETFSRLSHTDTHSCTFILFFLSNIYRFLCLAPLTAPCLPLSPQTPV